MCITPESLALERSGRTVLFHNFIVEYKKNSSARIERQQEIREQVVMENNKKHEYKNFNKLGLHNLVYDYHYLIYFF